MDDRLFDPAAYGATATEPRRRRQKPDMAVVDVEPPWVVLRHLRKAPVAHAIEIDAAPVDDKGKAIAGPEVRLAACGAFGLPMRDLARTRAPACPGCTEKLAKR